MQPQVTGLWDRCHYWIKWLKIGVYIIVGLFFFLLLAEVARLYMLAADIDPWLGYAFIFLALLGSLVLVIPAYRFMKIPQALKPPVNPPESELKISHLKAEIHFLDRYLTNCSRNPEFGPRLDEITQARGELAKFSDKLGGNSIIELNEELAQWATNSMAKILKDVDEKAEKMIYQEALAVGLGISCSMKL